MGNNQAKWDIVLSAAFIAYSAFIVWWWWSVLYPAYCVPTNFAVDCSPSGFQYPLVAGVFGLIFFALYTKREKLVGRIIPQRTAKKATS